MSVIHTVSRRVTAGGTTLFSTETFTSDQENNFDGAIANPTTNQLIEWAMDISQLKSLFIMSDRAITIKTNSSGSPQETLSIPANSPLQWTVGGFFAIPFAGDVTALYVTNASGATANLQIRSLYDGTP